MTVDHKEPDLTALTKKKEEEIDEIVKDLQKMGLLEKVDPRLIHSADGDRDTLVETATRLGRQRFSILERLKAILRRNLTLDN